MMMSTTKQTEIAQTLEFAVEAIDQLMRASESHDERVSLSETRQRLVEIISKLDYEV